MSNFLASKIWYCKNVQRPVLARDDIFYFSLKPVAHVRWCIRTCSLAFCCTATASFHWYSYTVLVLWMLIQSKWCLSCDQIKHMTVLWLIVGLGQWFFLTFFTYLTLLSNKITRFIPIHSMVLIYWKYEHNKLLQFRMINKILHWLQFMVQQIYTLVRWTLPLVKNHWPREIPLLCVSTSTITFTLSS